MSLSSVSTGLLGFSKKFEFLGNGLYFRETNTYNYEIYAIPNLNGASGDVSGYFNQIENLIKGQFSGYSGDVTVKALGSPADYQFPNDHIRAGKFNVEVQLRRCPTGLTVLQPEISGNYYKGLSESFFTGYSPLLDTFSEDFSFENNDNGNQSFSHNCSFVLRSGGKGKAVEIASGLFTNDKDTTFGISAMAGGITFADTGSFQNYYNESYDLLKNSFSFSKKREFLPFLGTNYLYNLNHSLNVNENGIIDVSEKGEIQGKLSFNNALLGYDVLKAGSSNRCSDIYSAYKDVAAGVSVGGSLSTLPITSTKTLLKPNLSINYELKYSDDPNINSTNLYSLEKVLDVELVDSKYININHTYNFTALVNPVYANMDADFIGYLAQTTDDSPLEIQNFYNSSVFYNSSWPTENLTKRSASLPNKRKNFSISFSYTNNPIYFVTINGITYNFLDFKISDTFPPDQISEYKVINRPTKTSVINYAYQTERGTKNISVTARLMRTGTTLTNPINISTNLLDIYRFATQKLLSTLFNINTLALNYYLSDIKYKFSSTNELVMDLAITYTIKKYTA